MGKKEGGCEGGKEGKSKAAASGFEGHKNMQEMILKLICFITGGRNQ